ncbi:MAG: DUF3276 family protein [Bacteroidetes bacterium]|nr:MAG: DUF3276 family protein [Bacteroidota bacterium]
MDGKDTSRREDIFSKPVRAGKRTYFFDVKATRGNDFYITITESKRRIDDGGKFHYDKHKIFLYREDFEKFAEGLQDAIAYIRDQKGDDYLAPRDEDDDDEETPTVNSSANGYTSDLSFDDLDDGR